MNKVQASVIALCMLLLCSPANSDSEVEQWRQRRLQSFLGYWDERAREFTAFL